MTPEQIESAVQAGIEKGMTAALQKQPFNPSPCATCLIYTIDLPAVEKHKDHHAKLDGVFSGFEGMKTEMLSSLKQTAIGVFKWSIIFALILMVIGLTRISMADVLAAFSFAKGK